MLVGGKVLDASAVAAWASGGFAIQSWVIVAADLGLALYLPSLARVEVETLWPPATVLIEDLAAYPNVVVGRLDPKDATAVDIHVARSTTGTAGLSCPECG